MGRETEPKIAKNYCSILLKIAYLNSNSVFFLSRSVGFSNGFVAFPWSYVHAFKTLPRLGTRAGSRVNRLMESGRKISSRRLIAFKFYLEHERKVYYPFGSSPEIHLHGRGIKVNFFF